MIMRRRRRPRLHNIITIVNVSLRTRMIAVMIADDGDYEGRGHGFRKWQHME